MIHEQYVTLETAKLLKEAGFPQEGGYDCYFDKDNERYSIPSQSIAMRWLRDDCHLAIVIEYTSYNGWEYTLLLDYDTDCSRMVCSVGDDTYEAAAEAGIRAACEYIISKQ